MKNENKQNRKKVGSGDKRIDKRLEIMLDDFTSKPNATIPEACNSKAKTKAAYRFFDSKNVLVKDIEKVSYTETLIQIEGHKAILVAQDTSNIDYTGHIVTKGLGYLDKGGRGIKLHSAIAISEDGVPLGIIDQKFWIREEEQRGKVKERRKKETKEKESQRWLDTLNNVESRVDKTKRLIIMSDRESDIYDYLEQEREERTDILIRAAQNRIVNGEPKLLFNNMLTREIAGYKDITITRVRDCKEHQAKLSIRYGEVKIQPPLHHLKRGLKSIKINAVLAKEVNVPEGVDEVCWLLLTTIEVKTFEDALKMVRWYSLRWLIERYHFVLKSGCQVEKLQLEEEARLEKAITVYCIVAVRLLHLTYLARIEPNKSSEKIFEKYEWEALYCFQNKITTPPEVAPTISEMVMMLAMLGGFMGRKNDGNPGAKVLWRGMMKLHYISETYLLFKKDVGNG